MPVSHLSEICPSRTCQRFARLAPVRDLPVSHLSEICPSRTLNVRLCCPSTSTPANTHLISTVQRLQAMQKFADRIRGSDLQPNPLPMQCQRLSVPDSKLARREATPTITKQQLLRGGVHTSAVLRTLGLGRTSSKVERSFLTFHLAS
jgi:hypothetical protein